MKNENQRLCPACRDSETRQIGEKNNFLMLSCRKCDSLYSSYLPIGEEAEDYDEYYSESNLKVPEFILKILGEIIESFQPHFSNGRLLDIGFGAATLMQVAEKKGIRLMLKETGFSSFKIQSYGFNPLEVVNTYRNRLCGKTLESDSFNHVETGYVLNESLTKSPARQKIKHLLNGTLNFLSVGNSLKIKAVK